MNPPEPAGICEFLTSMAAGAVATQRVLDAGFEAAGKLVPVPRMRVGRYEISVELRLAVSRVEEFRVGVVPLNLSYRVSHRDTEESDASVRIVVEQRALCETTAQRDAIPAAFKEDHP